MAHLFNRLTFADANRPVMIIETDPGNEIDDEIFIHWAIENMKGYRVYIMCVPGCETRDPEKASLVAISRVEHIQKLFPKHFGKTLTHTANGSDFHLCNVNEIIEMIRRNNEYVRMNIAYYVKIAPSWHINPWFYGQLNIAIRIVMGEISNPDASINCTKAMHKTNDTLLREEYNMQESMIVAAQTISIPTNFARQIAFKYDFIMWLPDELKVPLVDKWYSQFVGRPPAHMPWACDVSNANMMTIKNMFPTDHYKMIDIVEHDGQNEVSLQRRNDLLDKLDEFLTKAPDMEKQVRELYKTRLLRIALLVEEITNCHYIDSSFNDKSLNDNVLARKNWEAFLAEYNPDATPAYDLLAAVAIKEPTALINVEMCREALARIN